MGKIDKSLIKKRPKKVHCFDLVKALNNITKTGTDITELTTDVSKQWAERAELYRYHLALQDAGLWEGPKIERKKAIISNWKEVELAGGTVYTFTVSAKSTRGPR